MIRFRIVRLAALVAVLSLLVSGCGPDGAFRDLFDDGDGGGGGGVGEISLQMPSDGDVVNEVTTISASGGNIVGLTKFSSAVNITVKGAPAV